MIQHKFRLRLIGLLALTLITSGCATTYSNNDNEQVSTCFTTDDTDGAAIETLNDDIDCVTVDDSDMPKHNVASHHATQSVVISQARVTFDFESSQLDSYDKTSLNKIADMATPNTTIHITGHSCNLGDSAYNQNISIKRANAVRDYLLNKGVTSFITTEGKGANSPIASNDSHKGRSKNRRANIEVSRTTISKSKAQHRHKKAEKQQRMNHQKKPKQQDNNYLNPFLIYH